METYWKMRSALDLMYNNEELSLNEKGFNELNKCWEDSGKQEWKINSINTLETLDISSDKHLIYRSAPLDWFNFE